MSVDEAAIQIELPEEQTAAKKTGRESPWPWLALLFALQLGSPYLPLPNAIVAAVAFIATTALYVVGVVQFIVQATRWNLKPLVLLAGTLWFLWLWWALDNYGFAAAARPIGEAIKAQQKPDALQIFALQFVRVLTDAALLGAAVLG
ncbi:MAG TPA: hypothetical protein VGB77_20770, partial [Abditibacteriaceae bacterium]